MWKNQNMSVTYVLQTDTVSLWQGIHVILHVTKDHGT